MLVREQTVISPQGDKNCCYMVSNFELDQEEFLRQAEIYPLGAIRDSSNLALLCNLVSGDREELAVYKPLSGERPLRDFSPGLYKREAATYELSVYLNMNFVPITIEREGPYGIGSLQKFIFHDPSQNYFTLTSDPKLLLYLKSLCGFDLLINNADRKASHVMVGDDGHIYGIDHGLCFHEEDKLRTVMWDFIGEPLPEDVINACLALVECQPEFLCRYLTEAEVKAIGVRAARMLEEPIFPDVPEERFFYPWPIM